MMSFCVDQMTGEAAFVERVMDEVVVGSVGCRVTCRSCQELQMSAK